MEMEEVKVRMLQYALKGMKGHKIKKKHIKGAIHVSLGIMQEGQDLRWSRHVWEGE